MTTVAKIKGYINGEERGVYEPAPELMTYQEIVAAATSEGYPWTDLLAELNTAPADYYNIMYEGSNTGTVENYSNGGDVVKAFNYSPFFYVPGGSTINIVTYNVTQNEWFDYSRDIGTIK